MYPPPHHLPHFNPSAPLPIRTNYIHAPAIDPYFSLTTEAARIDCLTKNVIDAMRNMKHVYLGPRTIIDRSWGIDRFRKLSGEDKYRFKSCMKEITEYLEIMQEWVDEIEKDVGETATNKQDEDGMEM